MPGPFGLPFDDPEPPSAAPAASPSPAIPPAVRHRKSPAPAPAADRSRGASQRNRSHRSGDLNRSARGCHAPGAQRHRSSTTAIRDHLESEFFSVWVEGELSNCKVWNTGHLYFTLKDDRAQLKGFMFRSQLRYLKFKPVDGLHVIARGRVSVYEPKGEYQITCEHLEPRGLGALQLAFDQLKKRLQAEGLFDDSTQASTARAAPQDRNRDIAGRRRDSRHAQGARPALPQRTGRDPVDARAGRGIVARYRAGHPRHRPRASASTS